MTLPLLTQLVRRTSDHLSRDLAVDAGLGKVVRAVSKASTPTKAVDVAKEQLRERARAVKAAAEELEQLRAAVKRVGLVLAFTPDGWRERRAQLEASIQADQLGGLARWLEDWYAAASYCRLDALGRLETVNLPAGASVLLGRCTATRRGLDQRNVQGVRPLLEAGARGIVVDGRTVPSATVRADLRLLLVRLALDQQMLEEADDTLAEGERSAPSAALDALRARRLRLAGDFDAAATELELAASTAPADLDVAVELIESARSAGSADVALDAARVAVAALPMLADVDAEIGRLVAQPPPELWAAVAERALAERDFEIHGRAIERADWLAADQTLRALIAEIRAQGAVAQGAPVEAQVAALVDAGIARVLAGQPDLAVDHFERVIELEPGHPDASLRLADALIALAGAQPLAVGRPRIERALELMRTIQAAGAVDAANSWSFLSEAVAHELLAGGADDDAENHGWLALLAVCRSLAHAPEAGTRWKDLAGAAESASVFAVAVEAAARAVELDPQDPWAVAQHVQALTNSGRFGEALAYLREPTDPWDRAVKGYILVRKGDPQQALTTLLAANPDPNWPWAAQALITALLLTDRFEEAIARAQSLQSWWIERSDESEGAWQAAWASIVLGDLETAEGLLDKVSESDAAEISGMVKLLRGDGEGGIAALRSRIEGTVTMRQLRDVNTIVIPTLRVLAERRGASLPDFEPLEAEIATRRRELEQVADPYVALEQATVPEPVAEQGKLAKTMTAALLHLAEGDPGAALDAVEHEASRRPDDAELVALRNLAAARQAAARAPAVQDETPTLETAGELAGAAFAAARGVGEAAASAVRSLIEDADEGALASSGPVRPLEAVLPPSWFAEFEDPLHDHPLFVKHIPTARLRAAWDVPATHVRVDEQLEPDRYQILVRGNLAEEGRASREHVYAPPAALELLGLEAAAAFASGDPPGLARLRADAVDDDGIAGLLTMPAAEVVADRIAEVAGTSAERLRLERDPWHQRLTALVARGRHSPEQPASRPH